ncbi:hypothetical protein [Blastococcus sp. SYSU D00820]
MVAEDREPERPARRRLSRRAALLLVLMVLVLTGGGAAAGYLVASRMPEVYAARAEILYSLTQEQPTGFLREDRNLSTQLVLLTSRTVLDPVAEEWDRPVPALAEQLSATVVEESEVIRVELTDTDPDRARGLLDAIVARYLEVSDNNARSELQNYLDAQLTEVLERIALVQAGPVGAQGELAALVQREQWLRTQLDELQFTALAGPAAEVLVAPYVDADPVSPKPVVTTAAGAASGLVVALLVTALVARRLTRPRP